jgi:hypothetical protein
MLYRLKEPIPHKCAELHANLKSYIDVICSNKIGRKPSHLNIDSVIVVTWISFIFFVLLFKRREEETVDLSLLSNGSSFWALIDLIFNRTIK